MSINNYLTLYCLPCLKIKIMSIITELEMIRLVDMVQKLCMSREVVAQCYENANDLVADWIIQNKIQVIN